MDRWAGQMKSVPRQQIASLIRLGTKVVNLISFGKRRR
jgi:hypothetical protein